MYADIFGTLPIAEAFGGARCWFGNGAGLHDVSDCTVPAIFDHAEAGCAATFAGIVFWSRNVGGIVVIGYFFQVFGSHFI